MTHNPRSDGRTQAANKYPPREGARSERRGRRSTFTLEELSDALNRGAGIMAEACRVLRATHPGRSLSVSALGRAVNSSPYLQESLRAINSRRLDYVESALWRRIEAGDHKAQELYLRTIGAGRGYATNIKHSGDSENPVRTKIDFDFSSLPLQDLRQLQMALSNARVAPTTPDDEPAL